LPARWRTAPAPLFTEEESDDRLSTIIYTSGSTGLPKGAMLPEGMTKYPWRTISASPIFCMHYMPMNHSFGPSSVAMTLGAGGTVFFTAKSDLSSLFEDIALARPTYLPTVPRIAEMIYQQFTVELNRRTAGAADPKAVEEALILETRNKVLGGRVLSVLFTSAASTPELRAFMERCLGFKMNEAYGATEFSGGTFNNRAARPALIDYWLEDVPELGYFKTDKPYPRGEFWVKSSMVMLGYYKRPEVTNSVFTEDGYYKTGDIMAELEPDVLVYVDRRNNVTKLAQGEFVAIARIETIFTNGHALVKQTYLYGTSQRSYLLGVIVPSEETLTAMGIALDDHAAIKNALREAIKEVAGKEALHPYEVPRDFIVEREPFSTENGLLAGIGKYQRPKFKERYGPRLEQMYDDIAASQANELVVLRQEGKSVPVLDTVARAVRATLGLERIDPTRHATFAELGGDSLSALSCSILLEEIYDVEVPASIINNPAGSLAQIAAFIERARAGFKRPTVAAVHGKGVTEIRAADLTLEKFIDAETLAAGHRAAKPVTRPEDVRGVLVTGANGFLGRFLCLEWLERMAKVGGKVVCIVRGRDDAEARARVAEVFDRGDPELKRHFDELAALCLEVLAGDLAEPDLGLRAADWKRLSETLDLIVHPAALVNHMLPYSSLFGPNAVGTSELIRLAITHRMKPIANVSTVSVAMLGKDGVLDEDADVRVATPTLPLDTGRYAEGYALSKWAGEVLLREAMTATSCRSRCSART
jgi:fatty acid CoA ligase FadD9